MTKFGLRGPPQALGLNVSFFLPKLSNLSLLPSLDSTREANVVSKDELRISPGFPRSKLVIHCSSRGRFGVLDTCQNPCEGGVRRRRWKQHRYAQLTFERVYSTLRAKAKWSPGASPRCHMRYCVDYQSLEHALHHDGSFSRQELQRNKSCLGRYAGTWSCAFRGLSGSRPFSQPVLFGAGSSRNLIPFDDEAESQRMIETSSLATIWQRPLHAHLS